MKYVAVENIKNIGMPTLHIGSQISACQRLKVKGFTFVVTKYSKISPAAAISVFLSLYSLQDYTLTYKK